MKLPRVATLLAGLAAAVIGVSALGLGLSASGALDREGPWPVQRAKPDTGTGTVPPDPSGLPRRSSGIALGAARASGPPRLVGPIDPAAAVDFSVALRVPGAAALDVYLAGLYDPASPGYRQFLSAAEFGAQFGLPLARVAAVEQWLGAAGMTVLGDNDQRTAIRVRSSAARLADVFGVHLLAYVDPASGATFHRPLDVPAVPAAVSDAVAGLAGLDSRPQRSSVRELAGLPSGAVPPGGLGPVDLAKAYDIDPLWQAGIQGNGQTVAIVSFDTFLASDITTFDKEYGIDGPAVQRIAVGQRIRTPGDGSSEVTLDVEVLRSVAPAATILNFEGQNGDVSQADIVDAIVQDGRADVVSDSWGRCDVPDDFNAGERERNLRSLQAATAAGISIFVASGDHGAYDCVGNDQTDHRLSVDFPSASPYTVAVGGTRLFVRADGTYLAEAGWENYLTTSGGGGGLSPVDKRPAWQVGPGVQNKLSNGRRQSPDVAAEADPATGYRIFWTSDEGGDWHEMGGTSAATPFWAGSMLLVRQLAESVGVGRLGFVNPMLYELAATSTADTIFHDITRGGDLAHDAGPGWDFSTGLGSPDVTALARAMVTYLHDHPAVLGLPSG